MNRADYNVGTLESEIKVQFEQAVSALNQTTTALNNITSSLKDIDSQLNNFKNNTGLKELKEQTMSIGDAFKSTIKVGAIYGVLRKGFNTVKDIASANIDMIETTNLFEVQMGKIVDEYGNLDEAQSQYFTKAMAFQDKMNEKLATNKSEMQKYQAMYYGMLNSQLGSKNRNASYLMSESLTKAGYDIASLYNLDVETAMNKLKSGLAGQIESLRQIGIDVSEASLAKVLDEVGIDRSVQQLSYAEKEVARYIAIVEQAGKAQGDFARTFEQPANQLRVFKNQLIELKQVAGSFFVGLFGQIMPVINGIIMAIKEVLKALGSVFGFKIDVGNSSLGAVSDTIGDIGSGLGSATKKAKEFKKQIMGFDELNNIEPPSLSNKGSDGGTVGGIDSKLLDALKEWDNKMDSISGKAQEIRDKILDWLGFTRDAEGNLKWAWKDMDGMAKVITVIAGIVGGIYILGKIVKLVTWLKTLFTILKAGAGATTTFGLGLQALSKIVGGLKTLFYGLGLIITGRVGGGLTVLKGLATSVGFVASTVVVLIARFVDLCKNSENFRNGIKTIIGWLGQLVSFIVGKVQDAFTVLKNAMSKLVENIPQPIKDFFSSLGDILAKLDNNKTYTTVELTTGDVITPKEMKYNYNSIFDEKKIPIMSYTLETVLAEKFHTIITRGLLNTRLKDFYDIYILINTKIKEINKDNLIKAIENTFKRRETNIDIEQFEIIIKELSEDDNLNNLWNEYCNKNQYVKNVTFKETIDALVKIIDLLKD